MFIIKHKNIFIGISVALVAISIALLLIFGLNIGIDFKGGALTEVSYSTRPSFELITERTSALEIGEVLVQPTGDEGYIVKSRDLSDTERTALLAALNAPESGMVEKSFTSIGPSIGKELRKKAILSIVLVSLGIVFFIAYAFRKVSKPVRSWKYGVIAIITLLHDVLIPVGLFALLSHFQGAEVDSLFVVAVLTILGLSVSDTIVVFDRIRENLRAHTASTFAETIGKSLEQTFSRSINTSLTVILALVALFIFGPVSTRYFALMLAAGMFFGTYSSIFLASPLLVSLEEWQAKRRAQLKMEKK